MLFVLHNTKMSLKPYLWATTFLSFYLHNLQEDHIVRQEGYTRRGLECHISQSSYGIKLANASTVTHSIVCRSTMLTLRQVGVWHESQNCFYLLWPNMWFLAQHAFKCHFFQIKAKVSFQIKERFISNTVKIADEALGAWSRPDKTVCSVTAVCLFIDNRASYLCGGLGKPV